MFVKWLFLKKQGQFFSSEAVSEEVTEAPEVAAIDKLAGMELTNENADEWVKTFNAAMDDMLKVIEAKDEAQAKAMGEKLSPIMDKLDASGDILNEEQAFAMMKKLAEVMEAAEKSGMKLE